VMEKGEVAAGINTHCTTQIPKPSTGRYEFSFLRGGIYFEENPANAPWI